MARKTALKFSITLDACSFLKPGLLTLKNGKQSAHQQRGGRGRFSDQGDIKKREYRLGVRARRHRSNLLPLFPPFDPELSDASTCRAAIGLVVHAIGSLLPPPCTGKRIDVRATDGGKLLILRYSKYNASQSPRCSKNQPCRQLATPKRKSRI